MEYYLAIKKEQNFTLCDNMDKPGKHYAQCNKTVRERQIPHEFIYEESNEQTELTSKRETDA